MRALGAFTHDPTHDPIRHLLIDADTAGVPQEFGYRNINGPSVLLAPDWMPDPPARYLLYFAHHIGASIRLAVADAITGPWRMVTPDVLNVAATPSRHPAHIASPDVHLDVANKRFVMYFHGMVPRRTGAHLPCWGTYPTRQQKTMVATSSTGLYFSPVEPVTAIAPSYLRAFKAHGVTYGVAMPSQLLRSVDGVTDWAYGPMLFDDRDIRHCCMIHQEAESLLELFYTRAFEAPERIYRTTIDTNGDWRSWTPQPPAEVLRPVEPWEGAELPVVPTNRGPALAPENGLRDPLLFVDADGSRWLFYAAAGESALAVTQLPGVCLPATH